MTTTEIRSTMSQQNNNIHIKQQNDPYQLHQHLINQQVQTERIVAARVAAATEASNKWRIILSIGLLLPALAAIVGIVAWAISIEVASDPSLQASSSTMFIKPVNKQRSSAIPSSLPLIAAAPNHNNHPNRQQKIVSRVDSANNRISFNSKNNNQYSDDGNSNVQALTSTVNLNIRSSHLTTDEDTTQKEPELASSSGANQQKDEMRKNNNKIKSSSEPDDNGAEARDKVDADSSSVANRKQHKERDRDLSNGNDSSLNTNDNASRSNEKGAMGNNNNNDNKNNKNDHLSYHQNQRQQHVERKTDILPKNKGVLAQSVYIVSSGQQDNNKNNSGNFKDGEERRKASESSDNNDQSPVLLNNVDMNEFEAIVNGIATTITATSTESELPTETNSDSTTIDSLVSDNADGNIDFATGDNTDERDKKSTGEHVAEVIDHIVEQRRQQTIANDGSGDGDNGKMPQIVVVAPVGGGQHLMKAHSLVKAQDSNKEIVKKPTNQTVIVKGKQAKFVSGSTGPSANDTGKNAEKQSQPKKLINTPQQLFTQLHAKQIRSRPLAARLIGPQTTTLSPFDLDSLSSTKQAIRYSEPVEVINDDDTDDRMLRSESQASPIMMLAMRANNDNNEPTSYQQQQFTGPSSNYPVPELTDNEHHRSLLISNADEPSQLTSGEYQSDSIHTSQISAIRSRLPRHETVFGLVSEARDPAGLNAYNKLANKAAYQHQLNATNEQKSSSSSSSSGNVEAPAAVRTAEQLIKEHISRSTQRSQNRGQTMLVSPAHQQQQQQQQQYNNKQNNYNVMRNQNNINADNGAPQQAQIQLNVRPKYAQEQEKPQNTESPVQMQQRPETRPNREFISSSTTEQSVPSSSSISPEDVTNSRQFTNRANTYQHDGSDNVRSPVMIESQPQQQQHYIASQSEYAPAQSLEHGVQSQQVVTIEYPMAKQDRAPAVAAVAPMAPMPDELTSAQYNQAPQQQVPSSGSSGLPQFADQEYNVPAHLADSVINDLQKSASTLEIYQGPVMQQRQPNQSPAASSNQAPQTFNQLSSEQRLQIMSQILRMQEDDIRSRMAQGRANQDEIFALEMRKRALNAHLNDLNKQQQQLQQQQSNGQNSQQLIPTLATMAQQSHHHNIVDNVVASRQPRIADRMQQQPTIMNSALALQRVLSATSSSNPLKATPRQGTNLASSNYADQQATSQQTAIASDESVGAAHVSQDQEAQESYGQMPAYHMPQGGGYGGGHHYGPNDHYEPQHDKKSKGITFHFGGGPIGGGSQLITSPMGILKNFVLPLMPNPNVHMTGKVVFGVVLEKSTGFGAQKKKSYKFWGR